MIQSLLLGDDARRHLLLKLEEVMIDRVTGEIVFVDLDLAVIFD